jgi:hypothetical protein
MPVTTDTTLTDLLAPVRCTAVVSSVALSGQYTGPLVRRVRSGHTNACSTPFLLQVRRCTELA